MQEDELEGAGEGAEDLELEGGENQPTGADPLDDIQDEAARAEAKKARAISRRLAKKEPKVEEPVTPKADEFLTRKDFQKANEKKAISQVTTDPEIKAIFDKIVPFYVSRRGQDTTEDIVEDLNDAITIYKARNPVVEEDESARVLTASPVAKTSGAPAVKTEKETPTPPNFKLPTQPTEWYPKKES